MADLPRPLRGREPRALDLTPELVARCHREEPDLGIEPGWTPLSELGKEALADRLLGEGSGGPLSIFAYGSLLWRPGFEVAEWRRATLHGWHRSFCLEMLSWRATPEQPGLMMCLEPGGRCEGLLARVPDGQEREVARALVRREITVEEDVSMVRWVTARTIEGPVRALLFWAGPRPGKGIASRLPLPQVAHRVARACGHMGSNAEYLCNTVAHLEELGIRDRNLWTLQKLVAAEIRPLTGP